MESKAAGLGLAMAQVIEPRCCGFSAQHLTYISFTGVGGCGDIVVPCLREVDC